ncbi:MAG: DNA polymerase I [Proteobacteria bacterium]|nr:DNA polymerase I [Pseudomonadota bacterium]
MAKLFALDSMAILYRNYFAMIRNPMINSKGLNTSGIYGFFSQIARIIDAEKPDYLAVVSDTSEPTFRHKQFPEYKATREKMPDDLVEQLPYLPKLVEALKLPFITFPGYEADDIIGTLMRICAEKSIQGIMVTSDKDYMQLITETNCMYNHKNQKLGIKQVEEKFGCKPDQVIDILGLMGDSSDNVPGVKGVGEKTAMKLISQYGSIPNLYGHIDELPKNKMKEKLIADKDNAFLSRELVTIDVNVPLKFTLDDLKMDRQNLVDNQELISLLEDLEFKSFLKKFKTSTSNTSPGTEKKEEIEQQPESDIEVKQVEARRLESMQDLKSIVKTARQTRQLAFDVIKKGDHFIDGEIEGLVFAMEASRAWYLPLKGPGFAQEQNEIGKELKLLFASKEIKKVTYNWKHVLQLLSSLGINGGNEVNDVMLAAHLVESDERDYSLKAIFSRQLQYRLRYLLPAKKLQPEQGQEIVESEADYYLNYCEQTGVLWQLWERLEKQLEQTGMKRTFQYVEMPLAEVLAKVEQNGVKIDSKTLITISAEFEERLDGISQEIYAIAGESFNINSVVELQSVLYDKLEIHTQCNVKPKKIKLGNQLSTDEETLEKMNSHPLPRLILQYRELNKLKNTYVDQLPTFVNPGSDRIHSSFRQTVAATGRLASDNPNLQNIPIRTEEGRRIRSVFIPSDDDHILVSADYSQIELRVIAHFSKDPTFMSAYRQNLDIHALTASTIFEVAEDEVTREMRSKAKEVNFGLIYRMGPERLSLITHTTKTEAKGFIERYFHKYSTIHTLQELFLEQARKEGYAQTLMGRRRYLPAINARGLHRRMAEGAAVNTPIQGTAAEIIKLAMNAIQFRLQKEKLRTKMILTVHDELVFDTPKTEKDRIIELVKHEMENVITLEVPLIAEVGIGSNWLEAH